MCWIGVVAVGTALTGVATETIPRSRRDIKPIGITAFDLFNALTSC